MKINEIANQLVAYCSKADWEGAYNTLYAEKILSLEPVTGPFFEKETTGLEAVRTKAKLFDSMIEELYSIIVSEPIVVGNHIAFTITVDAVRKNIGRVTLPELCVYTVEGGKIIKEEFFYN